MARQRLWCAVTWLAVGLVIGVMGLGWSAAPRPVRAAAHSPSLESVARLGLASAEHASAPLTTSTATATPHPLDPTPRGGTVVVRPPLGTPAAAIDAIRPTNGARLVEVGRPDIPANDTESVRDFSGDGQLVLTVGTRTRVRTTAYGGLSQDGAGPGYGLRFTPDGRYLLLGGEMGSLTFWDRTSQSATRQHYGGGYASELAFSGDGQRMAAVRSGGRLHVWDVPDGRLRIDQELTRADGRPVTAIRPDMAQVAAVPDDSSLAVQLTSLIDGHRVGILYADLGTFFSIHDLSWSPDGSMLIGFTSDHHNIHVPDTDVTYVVWQGGRARLTPRPLVGQTRRHGWSPDGRWLAIVEMRRGARAGVVTLWDGGSAFQAVDLAGASDIGGLSWNADGSLLAIGWEDWDAPAYEVALWDVAARRVVARIPNATAPHFSPGGSRLIVHDRETGGLVFYGVPVQPIRLWLPKLVR